MSGQKWRDPFWAGYKTIIRRYMTGVDGLTEAQARAVKDTIKHTAELPDGQLRIELLSLIFAKDNRLTDAADFVHVSERTARRWHTHFIYEVGERLALNARSDVL